MSRDNLRDGRIKNWFYLENELLDRQDLTIYEKMIYIVIARYVDKEDKAFPSVPTIAKKGSMSERQVQTIIKSLVKKGLIKKEIRINKHNKSKTSNLYTLLSVKSNKSNNDKGNRVTYVIHHPGAHDAPPLVNGVHPNNTNIKKTNLDNVNGGSGKKVVGNSKGREIKKKTADKEEDIEDIRKKIKESLNSHERNGPKKSKYLKKEKKVLANHTKSKRKYSKSRSVEKYPKIKSYSYEEGKLLAEEIAEELDDSHSLGAFRIVVDKIPEQRIRIFLSIIKDTYLSGKIKKNKGAMFISLAKDYASKNNINLNFR